MLTSWYPPSSPSSTTPLRVLFDRDPAKCLTSRRLAGQSICEDGGAPLFRKKPRWTREIMQYNGGASPIADRRCIFVVTRVVPQGLKPEPSACLQRSRINRTTPAGTCEFFGCCERNGPVVTRSGPRRRSTDRMLLVKEHEILDQYLTPPN